MPSRDTVVVVAAIARATMVPWKVTVVSVPASSSAEALVVNVKVVPEYVTEVVVGETTHATEVDPVTVTMVAVPSSFTSVDTSPTAHTVVSPERLNSTVVLSVSVMSIEVPTRENVAVVPETITSSDVFSSGVAVHVVVRPVIIRVVPVEENTASVLVAPAVTVVDAPGNEVDVSSAACLPYSAPCSRKIPALATEVSVEYNSNLKGFIAQCVALDVQI